ncbi:hypothetical protein D3C85_1118770 [compost metagenome]
MAHIGEEFRLRQTGLLGLLFCLLEFYALFAAFSDVLGKHHDPTDSSIKLVPGPHFPTEVLIMIPTFRSPDIRIFFDDLSFQTTAMNVLPLLGNTGKYLVMRFSIKGHPLQMIFFCPAVACSNIF